MSGYGSEFLQLGFDTSGNVGAVNDPTDPDAVLPPYAENGVREGSPAQDWLSAAVNFAHGGCVTSNSVGAGSCTTPSGGTGGSSLIGGTVYLGTPLPYKITGTSIFLDGDNPWTEAVYIPNGVKLKVAPGASLDIQPGLNVKMEGMIEAGAYKIFSIAPTDSSSPVPVGRVWITSLQIPEILPEWWGAVGDGMTDDTDALQYALDAAVNLRFDANHTALPPIPVRLTGIYLICKPLRLGLITDVETSAWVQNLLGGPDVSYLGGAILIGRSGPSTSPNALSQIVAIASCQSVTQQSTTEPFEALLLVRGLFGMRIENLSFDAAGLAESCVRIESLGGSTHANLLTGCSFKGATVQQVLVGPRILATDLAPYQGTGDGSCTTAGDGLCAIAPDCEALTCLTQAQLNWDMSLLGIERCLIQVNSSQAAVGLACRQSSNPGAMRQIYGIVLNAGESFGVRIWRCDFRGSATAMILAYAGTALVESCRFANTAVPAQIVPREETNPVNLPSGSDIYLAFQLPLQSTNGLLNNPDYPTAAGMTVFHCSSTGWRLLETYRSGCAGGYGNNAYFGAAPDWNVVILNSRLLVPQPVVIPPPVTHPSVVPPPDPYAAMPSVVWDFARADKSTAQDFTLPADPSVSAVNPCPAVAGLGGSAALILIGNVLGSSRVFVGADTLATGSVGNTNSQYQFEVDGFTYFLNTDTSVAPSTWRIYGAR